MATCLKFLRNSKVACSVAPLAAVRQAPGGSVDSRRLWHSVLPDALRPVRYGNFRLGACGGCGKRICCWQRRNRSKEKKSSRRKIAPSAFCRKKLILGRSTPSNCQPSEGPKK